MKYKVTIDAVGKESGTMIPLAFYIDAESEQQVKNLVEEKFSNLRTGFNIDDDKMSIVQVTHYKQKIIGKENEWIIDVMEHDDGTLDVHHDQNPEIFLERIPLNAFQKMMNHIFLNYEKMKMNPEKIPEILDTLNGNKTSDTIRHPS